MKKTITVNIGGFSFVINESAYDNLQRYLSNVEQKLAADSAEILQDIESRIAELLKERLAGTRDVVDESDIEYIQSVMGQPEDFEEDGAENTTYETYEEVGGDTEKALFRDMDNAMLGGVCSGLAKYFNLDPLVMRAIFIFFAIFLGSGILLYIILLVLIPEAKTTAQKLKMSGEAVNLESIKSHFNKLGTDINNKIKSKQFSRKVNSATNKTVETVTTVAQVFGKIIGIIFTIAGIVALIFLILYFTGSKDIVPFTSIVLADSFYDFLMVIFPTPLFVNMSLISLIFVIGIPLVSIIFTGLKLVFGLKSRVPNSFKIASGIVFGVAITFLIIAVSRTSVDYSNAGSNHTMIETSEVDQLSIEIIDDNSEYFKANSAYGCCDFMVVQENLIALKNITLYIEEGRDSTTFSIKTIAQSRGMTSAVAAKLASDIDFKVTLEGDILKIPTFSTINRDTKFRAQWIKIIIKVPDGKSVKFGNGTEAISCYVDGMQHHRRFHSENESLNNTIWKSENGDLECLQCWD